MNIKTIGALAVRRWHVPPPTKLVIEHTTQCNLHCKNCARNISKPKIKHLDKNVIFDLIKKLPSCKTISFEGLGEGFCHPEIYDIINDPIFKNKKLRIITNATIIELDRIKNKNITLVISPYGDDQLFTAVKLIKNGIGVEFNVVLFPENKNPERLIYVAEQIGVSKINYSHPQCFTSKIEHLDDTGSWQSVFSNLKNQSKNRKVKVTYPPLYAKRSPCLYPWYVFRVDVDGDVYPCSFLPQSKTGKYSERYLNTYIDINQNDILMGNIYNREPLNIWNSYKWNTLRERMINFDKNGMQYGNISNSNLESFRNISDLCEINYCEICLHKWGKSC